MPSTDRTLHQRADGTWTFRIEFPRKADGSRDQRTFTVRGTKTEAKRERERLKAEAAAGNLPSSGRMTVAEFLRQWLATHVQRNCARATQEGYAVVVETYVIPFLGHHRLDKLAPLHLEAFYTHLRASGGRKGTGLDPNTIRNLHAVLRSALRRAVKWGLLARSPLENVTVPTPRRPPPQTAAREDIARLLAAARPRPHLYMLILLGATTGMRRAELLALRWANVDLPRGALHVREARVQYRGESAVGEPKSASGHRAITLPPSLIAELVRHRGEQAAARLLLGPHWEDHDLVICRPDGSPWSPGAAYIAFQRLCQSQGVEGLTIHVLRHTHASDQRARGVPLPNIRERLGHSRNSTTDDLYAHVMREYQDRAAGAAEEALREVLGDLGDQTVIRRAQLGVD
jgi:integrase